MFLHEPFGQRSTIDMTYIEEPLTDATFLKTEFYTTAIGSLGSRPATAMSAALATQSLVPAAGAEVEPAAA